MAKNFSGAGNNKYGLVSKEKCDIKYSTPNGAEMHMTAPTIEKN